MLVEKYNPNTLSVSTILGLIASGDIAIPEIQRPFVWKKSQVRDLLDSLYKGYPTGYLIIWKNPNVKLKDGSMSVGKKILIDGQQRVTALMTAIAGIPVVNDSYRKERIKIAFNPFAALSDDKDAEIFAVQDQSHLKGKKWIPDVAEIFKNGFARFSFVMKYCADNPDMKPEMLDEILTNLLAIGNRLIGELVRQASEQQARLITLEVRASNRPAIALYEKHGFTEVGVRRGFYSHPTEDGILMTLYLP